MRKFKFDDGTEGIIYETLSELSKLPNIDVREYEGALYVNVIEEAPYFNTIYKVDLKTHKASYYGDKIGYMIDIYDNAKPINTETLKRRALA